jgi:hypothetical protein
MGPSRLLSLNNQDKVCRARRSNTRPTHRSGVVLGYFAKANRFPRSPSNDPMKWTTSSPGASQPRLCPIPDSHESATAASESRKLVDSGTFHLRNDFQGCLEG